jgi:Glycerophosphoryl diester phosphodiesterase family
MSPDFGSVCQDTRVHPAVSGVRPLIFAHRGGAGVAPENTIPAFDRGLALGADGLELDVHLSRDGVAVVHHDFLLDRTTDATGPIAAKDVAELTRVNACAGFVRAGRSWDGGPACVPTLREVLARYRDTKLIVELKGSSRALARVASRRARSHLHRRVQLAHVAGSASEGAEARYERVTARSPRSAVRVVGWTACFWRLRSLAGAGIGGRNTRCFSPLPALRPRGRHCRSGLDR